MTNSRMQEVSRMQEAKDIVSACIGKNGLWADTGRYRYQCWTRDFVIAGLEALLDIGREDIARKHLDMLKAKQQPNGKIPILYLDDTPRWLYGKITGGIKRRRMPFMLKRYILGIGSIENFSPWTKDSEILYCLGVLTYHKKTGDDYFMDQHFPSMSAALHYVDTKLLSNGKAIGGDWRDTMTGLHDKTVLTNNAFLYEVYHRLGKTVKARNLRATIQQEYYTGTHHRDYPGVDDLDLLGQSLAVLFDISEPPQHLDIIRSVQKLDTPFTFSINNCLPNPRTPEEALAVKRTNQYGVVWPFVTGYAILALLKMGERAMAVDQFQKWNRLQGFYEWYDPKTGEPHGGKQQLWSAALYIRVAKEMGMHGLIS